MFRTARRAPQRAWFSRVEYPIDAWSVDPHPRPLPGGEGASTGSRLLEAHHQPAEVLVDARVVGAALLLGELLLELRQRLAGLGGRLLGALPQPVHGLDEGEPRARVLLPEPPGQRGHVLRRAGA